MGAQGLYAAAQPRYERALVIREAAPGPDHPKMIKVSYNLA